MKKNFDYTLFITIDGLAMPDKHGAPAITMLPGFVSPAECVRNCKSVLFLGHFTRELNIDQAQLDMSVEAYLQKAIDALQGQAQKFEELRSNRTNGEKLLPETVDQIHAALR